MKIAMYKDTVANRRGADAAVMALAAGLEERGHCAVMVERRDLNVRLAEEWDVVVSAGTVELLDLAAVFPKKFPWPVVQQFHTNPKSQFKRKRLIRNWKIRRALHRVAAIQVLSEAFAGQVEGYACRIAVIGNWSEMACKGCVGGNTPERKNAIVYPAVFSKGKNHDLLFRAFDLLRPEFPDWTVELYGKEPPPFDLPEGTAFMGYRDLADVYRKCAFVAFPSTDEGFPLTLVDAAAFGKPAVMVRDWIGTAAAGGGIVARAKAADYANGLRRFMSDVPLAAEMGERARSFCEVAYSRAGILDRWENLLRSVT